MYCEISQGNVCVLIILIKGNKLVFFLTFFFSNISINELVCESAR